MNTRKRNGICTKGLTEFFPCIIRKRQGFSLSLFAFIIGIQYFAKKEEEIWLYSLKIKLFAFLCRKQFVCLEILRNLIKATRITDFCKTTKQNRFKRKMYAHIPVIDVIFENEQ